RYEFTPPSIAIRRGQPTIIEIESLDRVHGFKVPGLGLRAEALPDQTVRVRVTAERAGRYALVCDVFCGTGHEEMEGEIVVTD
ncbi:MAG: cupredoxin domain-containing protein, partial [Proteobacteria bacterium]|nr:cupredoxin domain-containing protein [Pseudomonadota bacterium]